MGIRDEQCSDSKLLSTSLLSAISEEQCAGRDEVTRSFSAHGFDAPAKPVSFVRKSGVAINLLECAVAFEDVEADAPLQLTQAHRA